MEFSDKRTFTEIRKGLLPNPDILILPNQHIVLFTYKPRNKIMYVFLSTKIHGHLQVKKSPVLGFVSKARKIPFFLVFVSGTFKHTQTMDFLPTK